jgi:hypothetical protein
MKKLRAILLAALLLALRCLPSYGQAEVVVDPTHIGVAVQNTASSLEEMLTMIDEVFSLNGKLDDLYGLAEKVGDVADRFREVGYLVDMTESYNDLLRRTYEYSAKIREWASDGSLYGYETQLRYMTRCERQGIRLFEQYMDFFRSLKTSDADKVEQAQRTIAELDERRRGVTMTIEAAEQARELGEGFASAASFLETGLSSESYVQTYRGLGDAEDAASEWIDLVRAIFAAAVSLLAVSALVLSYRGMDGHRVMVRLFVAMVAVWAMLEVYNMVLV